MPKRTLKIKVGERDEHLAIADLVRLLQDTVGILHGIDSAITGRSRPTLKWYIKRIEMRSPLEATLEAEVINPSVENVPEVVKPFMRGLRAIERRAARPRYFSDGELTRAARIAALQQNGVAFVEYSATDEKPVRPTNRTAAHLSVVLGPSDTRPYVEESEIEGTLEQISIHGLSPQFVIYDPLTQQPIQCFFDDKDLETVADYLKSKARVVVGGMVKFNSQHMPVSITVRTLERLPNQKDLPQIGDLHRARIDLTGGRDSVDVVREMRDAE